MLGQRVVDAARRDRAEVERLRERDERADARTVVGHEMALQLDPEIRPAEDVAQLSRRGTCPAKITLCERFGDRALIAARERDEPARMLGEQVVRRARLAARMIEP